MGPSRRLLASGASAVALTATMWIVNGCRSFDCNDTATCAIIDSDAVVANDSGGEANDDAAASSDIAVVSNDGAAEANDRLETSTVLADADDAGGGPPIDAPVADAGRVGPGDAGSDTGSDAAFDAGARCGSSVLTPIAAVASSMTTHLAGEAIDRNFATRWESVWGVDPQWIYVDFGAKVFVNRVQIAWLRSCAANYDLQVSNDATTWVTMRSIVANTTGGSTPPADWSTAIDHPGLTGFGRYVRVNAAVRCVSTYGYSMWEMQVFGDRNASCSP